MDGTKLVRVTEAGDPRRCQETTGKGQCWFTSVEGSDRCSIHKRHDVVTERKKVYMFKLDLWQQRLNEFTDHPDVKDLTGEIGVLRLTLESLLNQITEVSHFILYAHQIGDLVSRIERCVQTCSNLEIRTGKMLDKATILRLAGDIVASVNSHVQDPEICEKIGNDLIQIIMSTQAEST